MLQINDQIAACPFRSMKLLPDQHELLTNKVPTDLIYNDITVSCSGL